MFLSRNAVNAFGSDWAPLHLLLPQLSALNPQPLLSCPSFNSWLNNPAISNATFTYDVLLIPETGSSRREPAQTSMSPRQSMSGLTSAATRDEKIEEGLERSRVLACPTKAPTRRWMLCMSANAFGSDPDWSGLESQTFRFRDPLNKERRFLPLRLDDAPIKGPLAQFLYINWLPLDREPRSASEGVFTDSRVPRNIRSILI